MEHRTFHLFGQLPPEIRARIWRHTVEPRTLSVAAWVGNQRAEAMNASHATQGEGWERDLAAAQTRKTALPKELYAVALPKPAVLDVCREVRALGLYEKMILTPGSSASYAWVNYDVDILELEDEEEPYTRYRHCGHLVRRLRLRIDPDNEYWSRNQSYGLKLTFSNLRECFVVMGEDARIWDWSGYRCGQYFSCDPDNVHLIDEENEEEMTYGALERMSQEERREWALSSNRWTDGRESD